MRYLSHTREGSSLHVFRKDVAFVAIHQPPSRKANEKEKRQKKPSFSLPSSPPNKASPTVFNRAQLSHASHNFEDRSGKVKKRNKQNSIYGIYVYFVSNYQTSETFILMLPESLEGKHDKRHVYLV